MKIIKSIPLYLKTFFVGLGNWFLDFFRIFAKGNLITKLSYLIMGLSCLVNKQWHRFIIFIAYEAFFIWFMITKGFYNLGKLLSLGDVETGQVWDEVEQIYRIQPGDNSMLCLLFGVLTIFAIVLFVVLHRMSIVNAYNNQKKLEAGLKVNTLRDDINLLRDEKFHITIIAIPALTITVLIIIPIIFMILIAFTNYDKMHLPPGNLFTWVGLSNFRNILWDNPLQSKTFIALFKWTMVWAFFATFTNYFLGMILALIINKKGIKLKGMWRTIFVTTIAVPQFVTLMLVSKLLADTGAINNVMALFGLDPIPFLSNGTIAKITVIVVNIWVGVPYTMLTVSGILMNIPQDLYESAEIDGAGAVTKFMKITLPYMLQVTAPSLITTFIGNINNFNVIFLLTGGGPMSLDYFQAGETDLLITWLYKLVNVEQNNALASVIGIIIFILCSVISLIAFNMTNSVKKEDQFQ